MQGAELFCVRFLCDTNRQLLASKHGFYIFVPGITKELIPLC